jgi:hypothetical protein
MPLGNCPNLPLDCYIHSNEQIMQKDSVYLPDLECYAETICLFTHLGVLYGNFQSNKLLALCFTVGT